MKKLRLDLDALQVSTFDTTPNRSRRRGTVAAHQDESGFCTPICTFDLGNLSDLCPPCDPEPVWTTGPLTYGSPLEPGYTFTEPAEREQKIGF